MAGQGQIIERGKNKYLVRVYMGTDAKGKRKYHSKTINSGKKDAQAYLTKVLRERDLGIFIEPSKESFGEYIDTWLEAAARPRIRPKTYRSYEQLVRLYIKPTLGELMLPQVTPEKVQVLYNRMGDDGLSPRTVRYTHSVLRSALQQAVKWGKIHRNPADLVDLPRHERKEMRALSPEEAARFIKATVYSKYKALLSLLITTGVRPGEAYGLKWGDVDLAGKKISINRTLSRSGKGWSLEEPKTARSRRSIPIPPSVVSDLREHKREQAAVKLKAGGEYNDQGFVFATSTGEPLHERNIISKHFKPLLRDAGLPDIRIYDLRHTCATLLLAAGENPKVVSERLGHASVTLTLDTYSHVLPDMQQAATDKLEAMLFKES